MRRQPGFFVMFMLSASMLLLQGCFPLAATGIGAAALLVDDRRSTGVYVEDENIEWKARGRLIERFKDTHVNVTSFNLTVLITGEVPSEQVKTAVADAIRTIPSVKNVVNELVIGGNTAYTARANDSLITTNIKTRFINNGKFSINHVKVVTESGTAFLLGIVTREEAEAAVELARNTGGVSRVVKVFEYSEDAGKR
ncbi:MAG: BON domain-containing protein [Betaproteobacteria bacterium]